MANEKDVNEIGIKVGLEEGAGTLAELKLIKTEIKEIYELASKVPARLTRGQRGGSGGTSSSPVQQLRKDAQEQEQILEQSYGRQRRVTGEQERITTQIVQTGAAERIKIKQAEMNTVSQLDSIFANKQISIQQNLERELIASQRRIAEIALRNQRPLYQGGNVGQTVNYLNNSQFNQAQQRISSIASPTGINLLPGNLGQIQQDLQFAQAQRRISGLTTNNPLLGFGIGQTGGLANLQNFQASNNYNRIIEQLRQSNANNPYEISEILKRNRGLSDPTGQIGSLRSNIARSLLSDRAERQQGSAAFRAEAEQVQRRRIAEWEHDIRLQDESKRLQFDLRRKTSLEDLQSGFDESGRGTGIPIRPKGFGIPIAPIPPRSGRGGGGGINGGQGPLNPPNVFGNVDALQRITRNIILYEVVSRATYGMVAYTAASIEAARQADRTAIDLERAAKRSQDSIGSLVSYAEGIRTSVGVSRQEAQRTVTEAEYFAEGSPYQAKQLATAISNIGSARGYGRNEIPDLVEQFRRRESKFYKRSIGKTVEELYKEEAERIVARNGDDFVPGSGSTPEERRRNNLTTRERVTKVVQSFTEEQKEQIAVNALIKQGDLDAGAAEKRLKSLSGQIDRTTARWDDMKESVGRFVLSLRPLQGILEAVADRLERLSATQIVPTGPGGSISEQDIKNYGINSSGSAGAIANRFVDTYGESAVGLGGSLLLAKQIGKRQASVSVFNEGYTRYKLANLAQGLPEEEAEKLAIEAASKLRPGIARQVTTGVERFGGGIGRATRAILPESITSDIESGLLFGTAQKLSARSATDAVANQARNARALARARGLTSAEALAGGLETGGFVEGGTAVAAGATAITGGGLLTAGAAVAGLLVTIGAGIVAIHGAATSLVKGENPLKGVGDNFGYIAEQIRLLSGGGKLDLDKATAEQSAYEQKLAQQAEDRKSGRSRFYLNDGNGNPLTGVGYTAEQLDRLYKETGLQEYNRGSTIPGARGLTTTRFIEGRSSDEENDRKLKGEKDLEDYRKGAALREEERIGRERDARDKAYQEAVNQQSNALRKLREAEQGSFKVVGDIANAYTGGNNPYVEIFADGATAARRMQLEWGYRGDKAVEYFTTLENKKNAVKQIRLEFDQLGKAIDLSNKASRERDILVTPGIYSRKQGEGLAIGTALTDAAINVPLLQSRERDVQLGRYRYQFAGDKQREDEKLIKQQIAGANSAFAVALRFGADNRQAESVRSEAIINATSNLTPEQIDLPGYQYVKEQLGGALRSKRYEYGNRVQDEILKSSLNAREDDRLTNDISLAQERRRQLIAEGKDPGQVGRSFDKFLISRTDNVNPKDLTYNQFEQRNEALRRESQATVAEKEEAKAAVKKGLEYQSLMLGELKIMRQKVIGGDFSMLLQIQNDSQARADATALSEANPGFKVALDQGGVKSNPYGDLNNRYGGARKTP